MKCFNCKEEVKTIDGKYNCVCGSGVGDPIIIEPTEGNLCKPFEIKSRGSGVGVVVKLPPNEIPSFKGLQIKNSSNL